MLEIKEFSRKFRSTTPVRFVVMENKEVKVSIHDASQALGFESPRGAVMKYIADHGVKGAQIKRLSCGYDICLVDKDSIIGLALKTDPDITEEFLPWFVDQYMDISFEAKITNTGDISPTYENASGKFAITQIAKEYGMSGRKLNELLCEWKILFKVNKQYVLLSEYQDKGFTTTFRYDVDPADGSKIVFHTYWTVKGVAFIDAVLQRKGYKRIDQVTIDKQV